MSNGLLLRKRVGGLTGPELATLRNAYATMQGIMDNRGYNYWAGVHGIPQWFCWHHSGSLMDGRQLNIFLPWHRAYIRYFELAMRDQDPNAVLPWWDWTLGGVPASFSAQTVGGNPNPLFRARITRPNANPPINRFTRRFPGQGVSGPTRLPTSGEIGALYNITSFRQFSNALERIHDSIHGWTGGISGGVGGDMGVVATAAYDPIFWVHHCMIDRVWYLWQLRNGVNNIPPRLLDVVLAPFRLTVRDVLDINAFGYEYAAGAVVA